MASKKTTGTHNGMEVRQRRTPVAPYLLILPAIVILLVALGYPVVRQVIMSTQEFGIKQQFGAPAEFIGFKNYIDVFSDSTLWGVIVRSIGFCLINAGLTVLLGTLMALLMQAVNKAVRLIIQIAMLLAWAMPLISVMTVFRWLFDWKPGGVVNWILVRLGLTQFDGHQWLAQPVSFFAVATIIVVWMSVPFVAFSVYAGLTQVSGEVLEAAEVDGANATQRFWNIIFPMVRPVISIVLLLQIIWDLRVFAQIYMLQDGKSIPGTDLLGTYLFYMGTGGNYGGSAAIAIFVLLLTIVLSWPYVRSLMKEDAL